MKTSQTQRQSVTRAKRDISYVIMSCGARARRGEAAASMFTDEWMCRSRARFSVAI